MGQVSCCGCKLAVGRQGLISELQTQRKEETQKLGMVRRCRGSNPGHPRDRREYSPLYYNDLVDFVSLIDKCNNK